MSDGLSVVNIISLVGVLIAGFAAQGGAISFLLTRIREAKSEVFRETDRLETEAAGRVAERHAENRALHERVNDVKTDLAKFQAHVPQTYASAAMLSAVEARLTAEGSAREDRLNKRFDRIEDKLDDHRRLSESK